MFSYKIYRLIPVRRTNGPRGLFDSPENRCYTSNNTDCLEAIILILDKPLRNNDQSLTLPYGPTKGMMQALQLMRKSTPSRIDGNFLRQNSVGPGNEYKVIGALRFLGVINDDGIPTEKSLLLKTKGTTFIQSLQNIVKEAYAEVFKSLDGKQCSNEDIYNHFVTVYAMGPEMAAKTTRFFVQLCQMAEIDLVVKNKEKSATTAKKNTNGHRRQIRDGYAQVQTTENLPVLLALTPEMAAMDTEELTSFFKKLRTAISKSAEE